MKKIGKKGFIALMACSAAVVCALALAGCSSPSGASSASSSTSAASSASSSASVQATSGDVVWAPSKVVSNPGTESESTATYTYQDGRLVSGTTTTGGATEEMTYTTDAEGFFEAVAAGSTNVKYDYDVNDEGLATGALVVTTTEEDGQTAEMTVESEYEYDSDGRLTTEAAQTTVPTENGEVNALLATTYDDEGNGIEVAVETSQGETVISQTYSEIDYEEAADGTVIATVETANLVDETTSTTTYTLTVDEHGNILSVVNEAGTEIWAAEYVAVNNPSASVRLEYGHKQMSWLTQQQQQ